LCACLTACAVTLAAQSKPLVAPHAAAIYQRLLPQISRFAAREITEPQALTIARGYLHDNAASLYK
jgi:hypothetical protein